LTKTFAVIILTFNEERNISDCLKSLDGVNADIFVVDSGSTDKTLDICKTYGVNIYHHPFENYGAQRNWAFQNLPVQNDWIINMDADHRMTPGLVDELRSVFYKPIDTNINGFLVSRKTMFLGKWIKYGGHYPTYHAIIFRKGFGKCEDKLYDQHFQITGKTLTMKNDMIDIITDSISTFVSRHNHWATLEAQYQFDNEVQTADGIQPKFFGNPIERRRYIKSIYERFPLFARPAIYFFIRYFLRLGFLDGRRGLIFHYLQGFWFRFLIDAKIYELRNKELLKQKDNV